LAWSSCALKNGARTSCGRWPPLCRWCCGCPFLEDDTNALLREIVAEYPAIVILEDADSDIGVCRQIENQGRAEHLLWRWRDYLRWAVENDAENWVVPGLVDASRAVNNRLFQRLEEEE